MADKAIVWYENYQHGDYVIANGDLGFGNDLYTSVLISLFTNMRNNDDTLPANAYKGGWFGDAWNDQLIGSRLYLLNRAKKINDQQLLNEAQDYCDEALAWLITDGIASEVDSLAFWLSPNQLGLNVTITEPNQVTSTLQFGWSWRELNVPAVSAIASIPPTNSLTTLGTYSLGSLTLGR